MSAANMTTSSIIDIEDDRHALNNCEKVLFLDGHYYLKVIRQLHVE